MSADSAPSLTRRLLLSVSVVLILFFGLTILILDAMFRDLSERSLRELLDAQMLALIAAIEPAADGRVSSAARLPDSRLDTPGSGLFAEIRTVKGESLWRSASTAGSFVDFGRLGEDQRDSFHYTTTPTRGRLAIASRLISWETADGALQKLQFSVASDLQPYDAQLRSFRSRLFGWFVAMTLLLLFAIAVLLRGQLRPLRRLEQQIREIEHGDREALSGIYPSELQGVTSNLNALLAAERRRIARYRDTLGNLAHSLKTPLSVIRSATDGAQSRDAIVINEQVDRMRDIVEHQLSRAAASGGATVGQAPVPVRAIVAELRNAMLRVYGSSKDLSISVDVPADLAFIGDRADFMELMGNLLDNACKWCRSTVRVRAQLSSAEAPAHALLLMVEDDGAGIASGARESVMMRGVRADERAPGHGLGLAMVRDTVDLYGGEISIADSQLGGACVRVLLPGRIQATRRPAPFTPGQT
ncbi:MAG: ATP-binding protein [Steroidobacteraceae bacterium]